MNNRKREHLAILQPKDAADYVKYVQTKTNRTRLLKGKIHTDSRLVNFIRQFGNWR